MAEELFKLWYDAEDAANKCALEATFGSHDVREETTCDECRAVGPQYY
jgi:hypothetical protein